MNINWSRWAAIAEIISSVAILVTLIYLSIQTQQNTEAILANTRQTMVNNDIDINNAAIDHPRIITIMNSNEELSADEKAQLELWLVNMARSREYQWFQYKNGLLDRETWQAYLTGLSANLATTRTRGWWKLVSNRYFDHGFVKEVNKYLKDFPAVQNDSSPFDQIKPSAKP